MNRIMIVDDEPLTRYALRKLISKNFPDDEVVSEADNGIDALKVALSDKPDVIFMDIRMPGMTGIEASEKILEQRPDTHIIILTAYDHFEYIQKALDIGVEGYLLKPISKDIVTAKIKDIFRRIKSIQEITQAQRSREAHIETVVKLAERDYVDQLIQNGQNDHIINQYNKFLGYSISYGYFLCIRFMEIEEQLYNSVVRERLRHKTRDAISRYLPFMTNYIEGSPRGNIIILFVYDSKDTSYNQKDESYMIARHLQHKLDLTEKIQIMIGIGRPYATHEGYRKSFSEAYGALKYSDASVIHIDDCQDDLSFLHSPYPSRQIKEIKQKMQLKTEKEAVDQVVSLINDICLSTLSISLIKEYLIQLYYELRQLHLEHKRMNETLTSHEILSIEQMVQLDEIQEMVIREITHLIGIYCRNEKKTDQGLSAMIYDYMHSHYLGNIVLDDIADMIGMTTQYTSKLFKDIFGVNFSDYLTDLRIEASKEKLTKTNMKVKDIAVEVGYDDSNYFCRIFKRRTGLTPKEFRNR